MHIQNKHKHHLLKPFRFSLGLTLGLWLVSANGFNALPSQQLDKVIDNDDIHPISSRATDPAKLAKQRATFKQAERAFKLGRYTTYRALTTQLKDYPLYPYLQYKDLNRQLSRLSEQHISHFLDANNNTVIGERFRRKVLRHYAKHNRWSDFIKRYQPQHSTTLHCRYLNALMQTGKKSQALAEVKPLWLTGQSQPKACDGLFNAWEKAGHLSDALIWARINKAMSKGRTRLARHIAQKLDKRSDRELVYFWSMIHRKPELAEKSSRLNKTHPMAATIKVHAIKRMGRKDPEKAIELWRKLAKTQAFSAEQNNTVARSIGLYMARQHHPDALYWLTRVDDEYIDYQVEEWLVRSAIRQGQWQIVINGIEHMTAAKQGNLRWQFWWAYAKEQIGHLTEAEGIYHYLASRRSYYGFLAADRLGLPYSFEDRPLDLNDNELVSISQLPEAARARELFELNKITDARREWHQLLKHLDTQEKLAASHLAHTWGWHDRAIVTMGKTDYRDDIALRFPLPLKEKIETYSQKHRIETAWTYAIIRRESAFMADAKSSVGALGLMQIMPGTARRVARHMKVRYRGKNSLLRTETNIKLGTGYLGPDDGTSRQPTCIGYRRLQCWSRPC